MMEGDDIWSFIDYSRLAMGTFRCVEPVRVSMIGAKYDDVC